MVQMNSVKMVYDSSGTEALHGVDLDIHDGEFVFLVGPSGSGKTTIIKLLTGEVHAASGEITVNGFDMMRIKRRKLGFDMMRIKRRKLPFLRRTLGVIFQDFRLIDKMTVYDNVAFAMRVVGASNSAIKERVPYVLELVGLKGREKRFPQELSGGEQQRVAIARALAKNPKLLLCDEPTGALDYQTGKQILQLLQDTCRRDGITVIIITHNSALAPMADRLIRFKSGRVTEMSLNPTPTPIADIEW